MHKLFPSLSLGVDYSRNFWTKKALSEEFLNHFVTMCNNAFLQFCILKAFI